MQTPIQNLASAIPEIFRKLSVDGFANVSRSREKSLGYQALGQEISISERENVSVSVTVFKEGRKASLSLATDDAEEVSRRLEAVCATLAYVTPDADVSVPEVNDRAEVEDVRFDIGAVTSEYLMENFARVRDFAYPENVSVESFSFEAEESERIYVNSSWARKSYAKTASHWWAELFLPSEEGGDVWYDSFSFPDLARVSESDVAPIAKRLFEMSKPSPATFGSGMAAVALESGVFADFLDVLVGAVTAENIRQKTTFLEESDIGKPVMPKGFSLRSLARMPDSAYGRVFDGEGVTARDLDVVSDGIFSNVFADSKNAKKFGIPTTGNPSPSNLVFEGKTDPSALESAVFLFTNLMAFHTVDSISGKFALEGEGFELKNGKPVRYVKNVALSGNVKTLFANLIAETGNRRRHGNTVTGDVVITWLTVNV